MSEIGRLTPISPDNYSEFSGFVMSLEIALQIHVVGDAALCDSQRPSHRVFARRSSGTEVPVGSAWLKTAKHGPYAGRKFLSISIDDPALKNPLHIAAFPDAKTSDWVVVWRRRGSQVSSPSDAR